MESLKKKGKFKIKTLMGVLDNQLEKNYEGQLVASDKGFEANGQVLFVEKDEKKPKEGYSFLLDFTRDIWRGSYKYKNNLYDLRIFMKIREGRKFKTVSGISMDDIGVSLWNGIIDEKNKCTMQQSYIGKDVKPRSITYEGIYNKAMENISGKLLSRDEEALADTNFELKFEKNPKKVVVN